MTSSPLSELHTLKRHSCGLCLRPLQTCLCKHVQVVNNYIELIILQHPLEVKHAKNTARLLHLCLKNSQLHVGEKFAEDFFARFTRLPETSPIIDLLLYPETPEEKSLGIASPAIFDLEQFSRLNTANMHNPRQVRLWVLDATWRKSRKMLYVNYALQTMPRLKLNDCAPTIYTIRKAHSENQLSTLEASCYALQQLEQNLVNYTPVLTAFADFIAQQKVFIPTPHS